MAHILTLHEPARAMAYYKSGAWKSDTLYSLLRKNAAERGHCFALRDDARRITWAQWLQEVEGVAQALDSCGLTSGNRVCVWLPNRIEAFTVLLACSRNGYVCNPSLHQNYTVDEVVDLVKRLDAKVLFAQGGYGADGDRVDVFERMQPLGLRRVFAMEKTGVAAGSTTSESAEPFPAPIEALAASEPVNDPDKVVYIAFTSGTTGAPKGVMHSDNTLLANGRAMVEDWRHDPSTILLSLSPVSHHIATVALEQTLVAGFELVVTTKPNGKAALARILETDATYVMGVPTHAMDVLAAMQEQGVAALGKVKTFYLAGAPIPKETCRRLLALGVKPQNVYGMTENGSHQYTRPSDDADTITGTCGKPCGGYEVALWSQDNPDVPVAAGEIGEIGTRGGLLMLGYFANQAATETSFNRGGWFMSGDLGRMDAKGNLQIVGRKKDLIIRGGHNIHPARIEDLAHRHPAVAKAAAFAIADERLGEKVCLAVLVAPGVAVPEAADLLAHLDAVGLSKYDMPEYLAFPERFPLTASGKVLKRELMAWAQRGQLKTLPVRFERRKEG